MLDAQTAAQRPGAALPPQYQPDARRIHESHSAEVHHQNARAAGEQGVVQLDAKPLRRVVVDLAGQIGVEHIVRRAEGHCRHILISFFLA